MKPKYKHSGAFGDLIYSLPICKHFGPGDFYLHLNQIDWIGEHYYGSAPAPFHQGRMTRNDFLYMKSFIEAQAYIDNFEILSPNTTEITHNLDRFRPAFVGHPDNYIHIYAEVFGLRSIKEQLSAEPWLTVPKPKKFEDRDVCINRSQRWIPTQPYSDWDLLRPALEERSFFVGLPIEYEAFCNQIGWRIPHAKTVFMLEVAELIAGSKLFIGNQSQSLALAVGLGQNYICEPRQDLPIARNECYFATNPRGQYMGLTEIKLDHII